MMKLMVVLFGGALAFALSSAAVRADASCDGAATQAAMNACAAQNLKAADAALNASYGAVRQRLKGETDRLQHLVRAQRAWIAFRDAECSFTASAAQGGSIASMIAAECQTRLTALRTEQLEQYLVCSEGDISCPVP